MKNNLDRINNVNKQKDILNDLQIFEAIDVRNWEWKKVIDTYPEYIDLFSLKNVKKGAIGCYISHFKLYELFRNLNKKYMIVLEDDFNVKNNFYENIEQLLIDLPTNFDFVYIYYDEIYYKNSLSKYETIKSYKKCDPMYQTIGYIISKNFLKKIRINKIKRPIDNELIYMMKMKHLNYYASKKTLISNQGLGYTTNNKYKSLIHNSQYFL